MGVLERLLDFLGLPLVDPSGKYGFKDLKTLTDLLALQINRTPRKQCFEDQVGLNFFSFAIHAHAYLIRELFVHSL